MRKREKGGEDEKVVCFFRVGKKGLGVEATGERCQKGFK